MCPNCINSICQNKCIKTITKPMFGIIWHYEGGSPTLFTCEATDQKTAEAKFEAEMAKTKSIESGYYIDSVHRIER
ncbi:hypothetical protein VHA01S_085_00130 [Vibrio halioticoli NBRC 102217]|uniref:Uncharacterized protein n=1 Tax=Vibrio halioticoli NBRC 102217 TaxID=1219072 RepID=V5FP45_9VIBR|nr:hypothetical protein VHA01S_085_00130 [Vibrio halioticoli NBRC 102217]